MMDEQRAKERIRACELKISDMEQQVLILTAKIEREKQILEKRQRSFEKGNYVEIKERP
jgi:peptidoglycan hydrolase CwlO-like protein